MARKPSSPRISSLTHPPLFLPPFSSSFTNFSKSISSLMTITHLNPTVYRYYLQVVFYIICKQLLLYMHCTCEFVIAKLHL
jgi:hypothetical protein